MSAAIPNKEAKQLKAENARLQAETAALREALEAVEWVFRTGTGYCPWCKKPFKIGHAPDCQRQRALASDAGRPLLERLRRAEDERNEVWLALGRLTAVDFLTWEAEAGGTPCEDWYEILEDAKSLVTGKAARTARNLTKTDKGAKCLQRFGQSFQ